MHRYVALIANSEDQDAFDRLSRHFAGRFTDWRCALNGRRAKAWVVSDPTSPIGFRSRGHSECIIGAELGDRQPAPWDGSTGPSTLSHSWGAYVAIRNAEGQNVVITRDPSGRIPCWTCYTPGADLYFSHIADVPESAPTTSDPIDWDYIQYHLSARAHGRQTGLIGVGELLPGRQVRYAGGAGLEQSAWPVADIIGYPFETYAAAETGLRAAAAEAVGGWARRYERIALDLSGGLDSAVVLGLICEQAPNVRVLGINYLIEHPEGDERVYAQAAADQHGVPLRVERVSADSQRFDADKARDWLRPSIGVLPFAHSEARARAASTIDAQAAFSGGGGDTIFGQDLPPSIVAEAIQDHLPLQSVLSIVHNYCKMTSDTFFNVGWYTLKELFGPKDALRLLLHRKNAYLTRDCTESANFERFTHPGVLEISDNVPTAKLLQIISFYDLSDYHRRDSSLKADEVHPLQSQLVLEASLKIPSYWMNPAGRRRGLARRAFRDLVPDTILRRRGKSGSTSYTLQILANNRPFLRELMLDGDLVRRGLLDKRKLEISLSPRVSLTKSNYIGLAEIIATELWVQSNRSRFH